MAQTRYSTKRSSNQSIVLCILWDTCHKLFCVFGDFYASVTQDAEVTKSLRQEHLKHNSFSEQNNKLCFFVHFFALPAQIRHEMTNGFGKAINFTLSLKPQDFKSHGKQFFGSVARDHRKPSVTMFWFRENSWKPIS